MLIMLLIIFLEYHWKIRLAHILRHLLNTILTRFLVGTKGISDGMYALSITHKCTVGPR